ncbi:MAG: PD40 domain-containing protein [Candidatus Omnitrophica bacterium]|nr:PD40 domain-containing protein [Candidatus Omnitrophota bacterium]
MMARIIFVTVLVTFIGCTKKNTTTTLEGLTLERMTTLACYDGQPKMSPDGKFVAYISTQIGDKHVFIYNMDDGSIHPLTANEGVDEGADFSPDNERIVFSSYLLGQSDLWIIDKQEEMTQVTKTDNANEFSPAWSSDGKWIFFVQHDSNYKICKVNAQNFSEVVILYDDPLPIDKPSLSSSENKVFFQRNDKNQTEICHVDSDGEGFTSFIHSSFDEKHPSVSPNGKWLAYVSNATGVYEIYISPTDRFHPVAVTRSSQDHFFPSWSSDGKNILFESLPNWDIKIIDVETQKDSMLVDHLTNDESPAFTPDGRYVIFNSDRLGKKTIFSLNLKDGKQTQLTNAKQNDFDPDISPDGKEMIFTSDRTGCLNIWITKLVLDSASTQAPYLLAVTDDSVNSYQARYSKGGDKIVYVSEKAGNPDIWIKDLKSNKTQQLTIDGQNELAPSFTDDDQTVLFQADWAKKWSIWKTPSEGGLPLPVTRDKLPYGKDEEPVVSPTHAIVAFTRSWYDDRDVWIMTSSGGEKTTRTLTKDNTNQEKHGRWSPDGKRVVFQAGNNTDVWMIDVSSLLK